MSCMTGGIGCKKHRLNVVIFYKFLQGWIRFFTLCCFCQLNAPIGEEIAHCCNFNVKVVLEPEGCSKFANPISDNTHTDLSI